MIFADVQGMKVVITGSTYHIRSRLGMRGFGLRWDAEKQQWTGNSTLKLLEFLEASDATMGPGAQDDLAMFRKAAEKRAAYMKSRAPRQAEPNGSIRPAMGSFKPFAEAA